MPHDAPTALPLEDAASPARGAFRRWEIALPSPTRRSTRLAILVAAIVATSVAHHVTPVDRAILHNVYQRLYYLPIFAAAYWFGVAGALVTAFVAAGSYLPHIQLDWAQRAAASQDYLLAQYAELVMFQIVAVVVGLLAEAERRQRERQERTAEELSRAYTRLQESFEQLRRADRLSALGELSASLAHEIKNPLASIRGSIEILTAGVGEEDPKREFVLIVEKELARLNKLVGEFLQFARPPTPSRQRADVREIVASLRVLCAQEASRHGVRLEVVAPDRIAPIHADPSQIQQALLNIVLNGIQAMPKGGRLELRIAEEGGGVAVRIRDEGPGIARESRERVFDPFFTTKARGTGLGLAIARRLVEAHGGRIDLAHDAGPGACFVVWLPAEGAPAR